MLIIPSAISTFFYLIYFDFFFNIVLILIFIFSENYLEEDLIIGLFSSIILFFLYYMLHVIKEHEVRDVRLYVKKVYRMQKKLLALYYFLGLIIEEFIYLIFSKFFLCFLIKLNKNFLFIQFKLKNFFYKKTFLKNYFISNIEGLLFSMWKNIIESQQSIYLANENPST